MLRLEDLGVYYLAMEFGEKVWDIVTACSQTPQAGSNGQFYNILRQAFPTLNENQAINLGQNGQFIKAVPHF